MSVLANILTGYTTLLDAVTGFTAWTANREAHDPDDVLHRKFRLRIGSGSFGLGPEIRGGTGIDLVAPLDLEVKWDPEGAESTIESTVADDILSILGVMLKDSNKPAGCRLVTLESISRDEAERPITIRFGFTAQYTETGTFT